MQHISGELRTISLCRMHFHTVTVVLPFSFI